MKLKKLFWGALASIAAFAACEEPEQNLGTPDISLSVAEMSFDQNGGEQELAVSATRDWKVETDADWVVVSPESGAASAEAYTVTVTTLENTGLDREASLKFTIGMKSKYLTVYQDGPAGSAEALIVYYNDFDKEEAVKEYGSSNSSWPYLDQFEGWKNATGTGAASVEYAFNGMSARANSTSDSNYSDYAGSGKNNMFFGASAYLATKNIALGGAKDFTLTFGTEKYSQDNGSVFQNSEFHIFLSQDGVKWVELTDYTFAGGTTEGRWNLATASFSLPEGTENLSICMQADVASSYRMDDMKLVVSEGGAVVDFSSAAEKDFGKPTGGNQGGGNSDATAIYSNNYDKEAATKTYGSGSSWPYLDQFEGWMNAAGTGVANVTYTYSGASARNNSNSNGSYSDYAGSGLNNIFFGADAYFSTNNIALNGAVDLTLTFGTEKYSQDNGSVFTNSEYHIWLSADGTKWVELTDYTFAGGTKEGRWNVATANFSVPAGTANLSICMQVDVASSYRLDDFKLVASATAGTAIDFSQAVEKDFTEGGNQGGGDEPVTPPAGGSQMTIAEVLASSGTLASGTTIEGVVISNMALNNLTSKKGMYVQDETAALQFYLAANHEFAFGDKVQIDLSGVSVGSYNGAVQVSGLALDKITKLSSGNTVQPKTVSVNDFLANKYEGQYVAIEGVQVADSDLSRTFVEGGAHTSINMVTAEGKTFVVFSSKYAVYGEQTVPQGSGTIKGISSINNGVMQLIFAQDSDFAGLTGSRFDGAGAGDGGNDDNQDDTDKVTIADFLAAEVSNDVFYTVTGTIASIEDISSQYNNATLTIQDNTGSLYIFRMKSSGGDAIDALGLTLGDELTVTGNRGDYNGNPQMVNGVYVSHVDKEAPADDYNASIVFAECGYQNAQSVNNVEIQIDENISCVFSQGSANNEPAYYNSGSAIRMYQNGAILDVKASNGKTIKAIELTFGSNMYYLDADSGSLTAEGPVRIWTGDASNVRFTATGTDKNHRAYVSAIKVSYE